MWGFILGLMTVVLAVNCLFLILLILIQLPKKEAGIGTAFGGSATDALFGAGTGNALTKMTKYSATIFFALSLILSIATANRSHQSAVMSKIAKQASSVPVTPPPPPAARTNTAEKVTPLTATNDLLKLTLPTNGPGQTPVARPATSNSVPAPSGSKPPVSAPSSNAPAGAPK